MSRPRIARLSILFLAAGVYAAILNFTFTVTNASVTSSQTTVSVSGPASLSVTGVGTDTGNFSSSGSLANVNGGNVTTPFTVTLGQGTFSGTMTYPLDVLAGSGAISGSATITSGTGLYGILANTTISGSGFSGSVLPGGQLSFSISGTANGRSFTFSVTNAPIVISGTSVFSGAASLTLAGNSPDTGTFSSTASLTNISGGNLTIPFTVTLGQGTITGTMTFPETVLVSSGPVSGSATITGGTGSYTGYTSSTLTASGTITGSVLSGGTISFSVSGAVSSPPPQPTITSVESASGFGGFSEVAPGSWVEIYGSNLAPDTRQWAGSDFNGNNAPTSLDGVQVLIGGQHAFVEYISASPGQVNVQLPTTIPAGGPLALTVTNGSATSNAVNVKVNTVEPGLLAPASFLIGGKQYVVALLPDGATYILPSGAISGVASRPAKPSDTITLYGIGFGAVTPAMPAGQIVTQQNQLAQPLQILFGQTAAQVTYDGLAPTFVGLYQFNVVVPQVPDNLLTPLTFNLGGVAGTQTLYIAVQQGS